jgi:hypothetical protein
MSCLQKDNSVINKEQVMDTDIEGWKAFTGEISVYYFFAGLSQSIITNFENGKISTQDFFNAVDLSKPYIFAENMELLNVLLNNYTKTNDYDDVFCGGEIIAGPDGEALLVELIRFKQSDGYEGEIADPVVYKTPQEAVICYALLQNISEKGVKNKLNLKKLEKAINAPRYFDETDKDELLLDLCNTLKLLQGFYRKAADEKLSPVLFSLTAENKN